MENDEKVNASGNDNNSKSETKEKSNTQAKELVSHNQWKTSEKWVNIVAIIASVLLSLFNLYKSIEHDNKINSIEHQITENFKSDFLELVTTLHSIKDKILTVRENDISDIAPECEKLADLRLRPGYFLMMYSFKDQQEMVTFNDKLQEIINLKTCFENTRSDEGKSLYADKIAEMFNLLLKNIDNTSNAKFDDFNQIKIFIEQNLITPDSGNEGF